MKINITRVKEVENSTFKDWKFNGLNLTQLQNFVEDADTIKGIENYVFVYNFLSFKLNSYAYIYPPSTHSLTYSLTH